MYTQNSHSPYSAPCFQVYTCTHTHAHILRAHIQIYNFYFHPHTSCTGPEAAQAQPCSPVMSCVSTFICSLRMFTVTLRADLKYRAFPCKESRREIRNWQLIPRTNIVTPAHCQAQLASRIQTRQQLGYSSPHNEIALFLGGSPKRHGFHVDSLHTQVI